jgi:hypothetical protein
LEKLSSSRAKIFLLTFYSVHKINKSMNMLFQNAKKKRNESGVDKMNVGRQRQHTTSSVDATLNDNKISKILFT